MRTRKAINPPTPVATAKVSGEVIRHGTPQLSTYGRTKQILRELGGDPVQIIRDLRWQNIGRQLQVN